MNAPRSDDSRFGELMLAALSPPPPSAAERLRPWVELAHYGLPVLGWIAAALMFLADRLLAR